MGLPGPKLGIYIPVLNSPISNSSRKIIFLSLAIHPQTPRATTESQRARRRDWHTVGT